MTATSEGGRKASATKLRNEALRIMGRVNFVTAPPFTVEHFTGGLILAGGRAGHVVTDYHICDARGRTVHVIPFDYGAKHFTRRWLQGRADRLCGALNDLERT